MRTIGLIGGMSWRSTIEYYRLLNEGISERRGLNHSAKLILYSVDFQEIVVLQQKGDWDEAGRVLASAARSLEAAGADLVMIGAVTMHKVADEVRKAIRIPLLHIVDATAKAIHTHSITKVGLLGTRYTMEGSFTTDRLAAQGIEAVIPGSTEPLV